MSYYSFFSKKTVFVSYDHSEDWRYRNLLVAWDANPNFDFEMDTRSPMDAINSEEGSRIRAALTTKMKQAKYLLVIVGEKSHKSSWMTWEIEKAKELGMKMVAVKLNRLNITPSGLLGMGVSFVYSFNRDDIVAALNRA